MVENHTKKKIKTLRLDNGDEFTLDEFKDLCREPEIKREMSTPYNPQQNDTVERKNRTIMEATKAMLRDQDLPMHLWAKAARTAMYVQNRTPYRVLNNKTGERNQKSTIFEYLAALCTYMSPKKRGKR